MNTLNEEQLEALDNLAQDMDFQIRSYSGRGMYGETCLGIVLAGPTFELGLAIGADEVLAPIFKGKRVSEDIMGRDTVIYFPRIAAPPDSDDED